MTPAPHPPLIGITTYGRDREGRFHLPSAYVDAIRRAGGLAVLVPPGEPRAAAIFDRLDGLLFVGGGDLDPALYGGARHAAVERVDPERDATEIELARKAAASGLPTLGICRGAQVINVALGGTLVEHLPDEVGERVPHRAPGTPGHRHAVTVAPGSRLAAILGRADLEPTSRHHQAIRTPARGLEIVARAPDGTIEAVEMPAHPWLVAVQFHCEVQAAEDPGQQRIFDEFVKAAARRARPT